MAIKSFFCVFALLQCIQLINAQGGYLAAVAEYTPARPSGASPETIVLSNVQSYVRLIEQARIPGAQIVVFPEYGLTTLDLPENLDLVSTTVSIGATPCNFTTNNTKFIVDLSCAARTHRIYTVVNLIERESNSETNTSIYYNTNVVFDRNGTIVASYRKINLYNEPRLTAGNQVVTFRTDFGVTFGIFTCWDILFRTPALDLLELGNVTDIIYPHAWFSETPFLQSLSLQDGYARANGVNFLVSGYNNATGGNGGTAIFTASTALNFLSISTANGQNIWSLQVPTILSRNPEFACLDNNPIEVEPRVIGGTVPDVTAFNTFTEDVTLYIFQPLEQGTTNIDGRVCSEGSDFCCTYAIRVSAPLTENSTIYKVGAFNGVRSVGGETTIGVRTCALMACLSQEDATCGTRFGNISSNVNFTFVSIVVSSELNDTTYYQPSTLTFQLEPVRNYTFCSIRSEANNNVVDIQVRQVQTSLFSFGVLGRVFSQDGQPPGRNSAYGVQPNLSVLVFLFIYLFIR